VARHVSQTAAGVDELIALEPGLRRYFRRRVPACDVDDLVQEVFTSLHARRTEDAVEDLQRYLFTVANHAVARRLSQETRRGAVELTDIHQDQEASPERAYLARERLSKAVFVIAGLPPRTREVFILHRFEELTYGRIARELGISVSAVEKHIMAALRALMHAEGDDG
jgi:RNA polymerase sigma factor (sigma-70 family)